MMVRTVISLTGGINEQQPIPAEQRKPFWCDYRDARERTAVIRIPISAIP